MVLALTLEQTRTRKVALPTCPQLLPPASGHMSNQRSWSWTVGLKTALQPLF
ncbi:hypothetical protein APTSU1_001245000 [Apodemus speciosus]|uniref:Uncharacterized protein n=1 Tax=Apodemus speciosus TaxID=105296 RepID=A0ABQ0FD90_APOSI